MIQRIVNLVKKVIWQNQNFGQKGDLTDPLILWSNILTNCDLGDFHSTNLSKLSNFCEDIPGTTFNRAG